MMRGYPALSRPTAACSRWLTFNPGARVTPDPQLSNRSHGLPSSRRRSRLAAGDKAANSPGEVNVSSQHPLQIHHGVHERVGPAAGCDHVRCHMRCVHIAAMAVPDLVKALCQGEYRENEESQMRTALDHETGPFDQIDQWTHIIASMMHQRSVIDVE